MTVLSMAHKYAAPDPSLPILISAESGVAQILHVESVGTEKLALVLIGVGVSETATKDTTTGTIVAGCNVDHCVPEGASVVSDVACGPCEVTPDSYSLDAAFSNGIPACCERNLYREQYEVYGVNDLTGEAYFAGYAERPRRVVRSGSSCVYYSDWFECPEMLLPRTCGSALWEWAVGTREVDCSVTWVWSANPCASDLDLCKHEWHWVYMGPGLGYGGGDYGWQYQAQIGDCVGGVSSPSPPAGTPFELGGTTQFTNCTPVVPYSWQCSNASRDEACGDCASQSGCAENGGITITPPGYNGTTPGESVTNTCTITVDDPEAASWVSVSDCRCGTTSEPSTPGTYEGERRTTDCLQGGAPDGYAPQFRWKLTIGTTSETKLELLDGNGEIYLTYKILDGRTWCCLCTNPLTLTTCGPWWVGCKPLGQVCVIPDMPTCDAADSLCFGSQAAVTLAGIGAPDGAAPEHWANAIGGTYILTPIPADPDRSELLPEQQCVLHYSELLDHDEGPTQCYYLLISFYPATGKLYVGVLNNEITSGTCDAGRYRYNGLYELSSFTWTSADDPFRVLLVYGDDAFESLDCANYTLTLLDTPRVVPAWVDPEATLTVEPVE
jgi:hypothetical protein